MNRPEPLVQEAMAAGARGDLDRAERLCLKALAVRPDSFGALSLLGFIAAQTGRLAEAEKWLGRAVATNPTDLAAQSNRGLVLQELGRLDEALACYDKALRDDPMAAGAHSNRGYVLCMLKRSNEALDSCDRAIAINPNLAEAHNNRGMALQALGRRTEALSSFRQAITLSPNFARAHNNQGAVLQQLSRLDEALASFQRAVALDANLAEAHNNCGDLLRQLGREEDAIACFDRAIAANPGHAEAHWNKALALLATGDYARGWELYEWRWKQAKGKSIKRNLPQSLWLGDEPIAGKTILLYAEQGMGDAIQFSRYAKPVADLGAHVVLEAPQALLQLFATLDGVTQLIKLGDPLPPFDYQCPLMSLPRAFRTHLATIPAPRAYLAADPVKTDWWRRKLGEQGKRRVGLVWAGGFRPDQPETWDLNARRNIDLSELAPLKSDRVEFYSLQKGEPAESDLARLEATQWNGPTVIDFTSDLRDFSDTAALVANLDLVITVDTSIAHLVGALGRPVWILNRFDSCWRWLRGREDSPWYPTATIYRQDQPGDWRGVIEKVKSDLTRMLGGSDPLPT